ncbi:MAG: DegV family protein [Firmicutes bacterium]|nr:DegV family protein [Bacillota bacterium]
MTVRIITDSTAYIDEPTLQRLGITVVPLSVSFPDESFKENCISNEQFYLKMDASPTIPTSSQPAQGELYAAFAEAVSQGCEVLAVFISSKLSGTYTTALSAKKMVLQKYPQARIEIIDSLITTMSMGVPVIETARRAAEGRPLDELVDFASTMLKNSNIYFMPRTLEYLRKGGRIGRAAAFVGSLLNMRPILYFEEGWITLFEKVRGNRASIERLLGLVDKAAKERGLRHVVVHHVSAEKSGQELAQQIKEKHGIEAPVLSIGPVIGLHVGPGTIGIVIITKE